MIAHQQLPAPERGARVYYLKREPVDFMPVEESPAAWGQCIVDAFESARASSAAVALAAGHFLITDPPRRPFAVPRNTVLIGCGMDATFIDILDVPGKPCALFMGNGCTIADLTVRPVSPDGQLGDCTAIEHHVGANDRGRFTAYRVQTLTNGFGYFGSGPGGHTWKLMQCVDRSGLGMNFAMEAYIEQPTVTVTWRDEPVRER